MAGDESWAQVRRVALMHLDGARPSRTSGWVPLVAPVVTQAAAGAGHCAAGRRQRALAEWAGAAGFGLVAWGLGTEAQTAAEVQENFQRMLTDLMRERGTKAPATARTETPAARRIERFFRWFGLVSAVAWMVIDVPWRLRHPRRLTVLGDRRGSPERRVWRPAGGPGRAAAQAEDGRRVSPGRSRIGSPAAGSIG